MIALLFFLSSGQGRKYLEMYAAYPAGWENALLKRWPRPVSGRGCMSWSSAFHFALVSIFFHQWPTGTLKGSAREVCDYHDDQNGGRRKLHFRRLSWKMIWKWHTWNTFKSNVKDCMWASDNWLRKYRIGDPRASCSSHEDLDVYTHFGGIWFLYGC